MMTPQEIEQLKLEAEAKARRQAEAQAKAQMLTKWAATGNDAALAGNLLGGLLGQAWKGWKDDYYGALDAGTESPKNPYTWWKRVTGTLPQSQGGGEDEGKYTWGSAADYLYKNVYENPNSPDKVREELLNKYGRL